MGVVSCPGSALVDSSPWLQRRLCELGRLEGRAGACTGGGGPGGAWLWRSSGVTLMPGISFQVVSGS